MKVVSSVMLTTTVLFAPRLGHAADQSFLEPQSWAQELTQGNEWDEDHPRMLADVNGDGLEDVVGFGTDGVWLATSTGSSFAPGFVLPDFGSFQGWSVSRHVRTTGDINNDGLEDLVGFGDDGVYRALAENGAFGEVTFVVKELGFEQGWRVKEDVRLLADVNGDGSEDIVAFGHDGVWLAMARGDGWFEEAGFVLMEFGSAQSWRPSHHIRTTGDVNGDGMQDIVAFGDHGVWVALSTGSGFDAPQLVLNDLGRLAGGWSVGLHRRVLADVDNDGRDDIVAFGDAGVWFARSNGTGFDPAEYVLAEFRSDSTWREYDTPRFVADLNADGYLDLLGFGALGVTRSLGGPGTLGPAENVLRTFGELTGWDRSGLRLVGDVNGDGMDDLVAFGLNDIEVALSTDQRRPAGPRAPTNPHVISATSTTLEVGWNDNSDDEVRFVLWYGEPGQTRVRTTTGPNDTDGILASLEPDTEYCFTVQAENLWDASAESEEACGRTATDREPPPPPPVGIRQVNVYNCHSNQEPVFVWTVDLAVGVWVQHGTAAPLWNNGSCPGNSAPYTVPLIDGDYYRFVVVDTTLPGCSGNDPTMSACQRSTYAYPLLGDADGVVLNNVVN